MSNRIPLAPMETATDAGFGTAESAPGPDLWGVALRAKWWICLGAGLGMLLGQAVYLKLGPRYDAKAQILVSKRTNTPLRETEVASIGDRSEHVALIMSPLIINAAVKKHGLNRLPTLVEEGDDAGIAIQDKLTVRRTAGQERSVINVLELTYTSRVPQDGVKVVQAIVDAYKDYLDATREAHFSESLKLIRQASDDLLGKLHAREQDYIAFRDRAPLIWRQAGAANGGPGETTNVHQERVLAIEADRRINLLKRAEIDSKIRAIEEAVARGESRASLELLVRSFMNLQGATTAGPLGDATGQVAALQAQLLPLILEEARLERDFGRDYPRLQVVQDHLRTIREFYARQGIVLPETAAPRPEAQPAAVATIDFVQVYLISLRQQKAELEHRDTELARLSDDALTNAKSYRKYQLEDEARTSEIKQIKDLYDTVLKRLNEVSFVKQDLGFTMQQIAPALHELQIKRQIQFLVRGGAAGFCGAFGLFWLRDLRDSTLKSVDELRKRYSLTVVGQVPAFETLDAKELAATGFAYDPGLRYAFNPGSPEAEAYRAVRTALFFALQGTGSRVLQVTSPEPQDGKSTLSANLALAMAHSGKRVLLLDADLRCPRQHLLFKVRQEIGLSDVLAQEIELANAIRSTELPGLSLLCAGVTPANPAEMLSGPMFAKVLQELREQFDYVIVDTPPVLAVSDPCAVAGQTDRVLLVVRLEKTRRGVLKRALEVCETNRLQVLGVIANGVPADDATGYYHYRYAAAPGLAERGLQERSVREGAPVPAGGGRAT